MATPTHHTNGDVQEDSVAELLKRLSQHVSTLVRDEIELAKAELAVKGRKAGVGGGALGGAGVLALFAFGAFVAAAILALATAVAGWLAAVIVAVVLAGMAGVLAVVGRANMRDAVPPLPEETVESVKEDVRWTKARVQQARH